MSETPLRALRRALARFTDAVGLEAAVRVKIYTVDDEHPFCFRCADPAAPAKLTRTEELILHKLRDADKKLTIKELCLRCERSRSAISEATGALRRKGLIERVDGEGFTITNDTEEDSDARN